MAHSPEANVRWQDLRTAARAMCDGSGGCTLGPDVQSLATGPDGPSMVTIRTCSEHCANCIRVRMDAAHPDDVQLSALHASGAIAGEASYVIGSFERPDIEPHLRKPPMISAT